MSEVSTTPETAPQPGKKLKPAEEVSHHLQVTMRQQFTKALPPQIDPDRFIRVVMTAVQGNPDLLQCNRQTLYMSCLKAAGQGLLPDGHEAALVPYKGNVQFLAMIGGLLKKVRNSGQLASIASEIIYTNDKFRYWIDDGGAHILHEPLLFADRGKRLGAYALAKTKDGAIYVEAMSEADIERTRDASPSGRNPKGPWNNWWGEMARKTVMKRLSKRLPMSTDKEGGLLKDDFDDVDFESAGSGEPSVPAEAAPEKPARQKRLSRVIEDSADPAELPPAQQATSVITEVATPAGFGTDEDIRAAAEEGA